MDATPDPYAPRTTLLRSFTAERYKRTQPQAWSVAFDHAEALPGDGDGAA